VNWFDAAPPLSMTVACGGERHRLRWVGGLVETVDHPELEAELALVALGGQEPTCIALHRLWHEAVADGGFVAEWVDPSRLSRAWLSWLSMALERMRTEGFHEFLRHLPPARAQRMGEFLHLFPGPWIDRAASEVNRGAWSGEPGPADRGPTGTRALLAQAGANRLRRAFVDAVGGRQLAIGTAALIPLVPLVDQRAGARPAIEGALRGPDRGVTVTVGVRWLDRVWVAGAAVVDGQLVLAIDDDPGGGPDAVAHLVAWEGPRLRPVVEVGPVQLRDGRWERVDRPPRPRQ
jgi:hypothetical protein